MENITNIITAALSYMPTLSLILFALVFATNIIVEVFKGLFPKLPTNILVFIVAIVITVLAVLIAAAVLEITVLWYYAAGALVLGIIVAYAAMYGFDKFRELLTRLKDYKSI